MVGEALKSSFCFLFLKQKLPFGASVDDGFSKAARNLPGVNVLPAMGANVYDILKHDTLVLTKDAVEKLEARFNG